MRFNSTLVTAVAGAIGNVVGMMNRSGMCFRERVMPTNPKTSSQQGVRNTLKALAVAWNATLTAPQRLGWNVYAATLSFTSKLGTVYTISGYDAYVACNGARMVGGLSRVDAPPTAEGFASFTPVVPTFTASSHTISVAYTNSDAWAGEVGGGLTIRRVPIGFNPGVTFYEGPFIYSDKVVGAVTPPTSPKVITLTAGDIVAGKQYAIAVRCVRADGRISPESIFRGLGV